MSAFQCGAPHLHGMLSHLRWADHLRSNPTDLRIYAPGDGGMLIATELGCWTEDETWEEAFQILWRENERSVRARYAPDVAAELVPDVIPAAGRWSPTVGRLTPVETLKACACYDYQACETNDYRDTVACALVDYIRKDAISRLAGYRDAAWEVCS